VSISFAFTNILDFTLLISENCERNNYIAFRENQGSA